MESFLDNRVTLHCGDNREVLKAQPDCSVDSIVTDPPYALVSIVKRFGSANAKPALSSTQRRFAKTGAAMSLGPDGKPTPDQYGRLSKGFMGKAWDTGETAFAVEFWAECLRVLKPGGHVVAFSGTRTVHRMVCAIEDAGFEIRDSLQWLYGSGFPKSHDVAKGLGKQLAGPSLRAEWEGWGTALKPAVEPICLARKPLIGTVAANVLQHGTGAINIDGCRIETDAPRPWREPAVPRSGLGSEVYGSYAMEGTRVVEPTTVGRWPANIVHDGSDEVVAAFPDSDGGAWPAAGIGFGYSGGDRKQNGVRTETNDSGSAARFFYTAKADADDRLGSKHPTVKPVDLMQWLCRLVTPKGGTVLDPFAGTGTTGEAAFREGFKAVLIERETEYQADIRRRMALCMAGPDERKRESMKAKLQDKPADAGPLFEGIEL